MPFSVSCLADRLCHRHLLHAHDDVMVRDVHAVSCDMCMLHSRDDRGDVTYGLCDCINEPESGTVRSSRSSISTLLTYCSLYSSQYPTFLRWRSFRFACSASLADSRALSSQSALQCAQTSNSVRNRGLYSPVTRTAITNGKLYALHVQYTGLLSHVGAARAALRGHGS